MVPSARLRPNSFVFTSERNASSRPALRSTRTLVLTVPATLLPGSSALNSRPKAPSPVANSVASSRLRSVAVANGCFSSSSVSIRLTFSSASWTTPNEPIRNSSFRRNSFHPESRPVSTSDPRDNGSEPIVPERPPNPETSTLPSTVAVSPLCVETKCRSGSVRTPVRVTVPVFEGIVAEIVSSFTPISRVSNSDRRSFILRSGGGSTPGFAAGSGIARFQNAEAVPFAFMPDGTKVATCGRVRCRSRRIVPLVVACCGSDADRAAPAVICKKSPAEMVAAAPCKVDRAFLSAGIRRATAVREAASGTGPKFVPDVAPCSDAASMTHSGRVISISPLSSARIRLRSCSCPFSKESAVPKEARSRSRVCVMVAEAASASGERLFRLSESATSPSVPRAP